MKIGKLLDLTNDFMSNKKCWVFQCMVEALANAAGKTTEGLMDELGIPMDELGHKTSEHSCSHNIPQSNELGPGDWYEDNDYAFAPGSEGVNAVPYNELGPGDWYEDNDYRFAPGA